MGETNRPQGKEDPIDEKGSSIARRQAKEKELVLEKLKETPVVRVACKKAGIAPATFYRWIKDDSKFSDARDQALDEGRMLVNDMCESQLISLIREKKMPAISLWLSRNDPRYKTSPMKIDKQDLETVGTTKSAPDVATDNVLRLLVKGDKEMTKWFMHKYMSKSFGVTPYEAELKEKLEFYEGLHATVDPKTLKPSVLKAVRAHEKRRDMIQRLSSDSDYREKKS